MIKIEERNMRTVVFVHVFRLQPGEVKHMMPKQFATVHEHGLVNWHIQISEAGGVPSFIRNVLEHAENPVEHTYQISLNPSGSRENHPPVSRVDFRLRVVDNNDRDVLPPISYSHPPGVSPRNFLFAGYSTPEQHEIRNRISTVINSRIYELMNFEVQTLIEFDVAEFLDMKYLNRSIGKPMPVQLNFRYNLLTNPSAHNFNLLTTTNRAFLCNKEALFVASPFFRKVLATHEGNCFQLDVEHLDGIHVVITWLLSNTYCAPEVMTPELADEIVKLAERILPRGVPQKSLYGSVERHCFEELVKNHEDMKYVTRLLQVAHNNRLGSLLEACHAVIISFHYADFIRNMEEKPNLALITPSPLTRSSAMTRLRENYTRSLYAKSFVRKLPPPVLAEQN